LIISVATGLALGATDSAVNHVAIWRDEAVLPRADRSAVTQAAEFVSFLLDTGWAWAAVAVLVGWLITRRGGTARNRGGNGVLVPALAGCVALLAATAADYGLNALFDGGPLQASAAGFWLTRSVLLGLPLGAVGALTRRPGPTGVLAGLVVPVGAVLNMALLPPQPDSPMARPAIATVWLTSLLLALLVLVTARRSPQQQQ
jgi:hypothetical protein